MLGDFIRYAVACQYSNLLFYKQPTKSAHAGGPLAPARGRLHRCGRICVPLGRPINRYQWSENRKWADRRSARSDHHKLLDFPPSPQELFNFTLDRYRAPSVCFLPELPLLVQTYRSISKSWISVILACLSTVRSTSRFIVSLLGSTLTTRHLIYTRSFLRVLPGAAR